MTSPMFPLRGLYVITDAGHGGHLPMARAALSGGAKILQLRDKNLPARELLLIAREIRLLTWQHDALLLLNDDADLALGCKADGVHLGDDDMPLPQARRLLGPDKIIGVSASTPDLARAAERNGANYLGVGAVFGTQTKRDAGAAIGIEALRAVIGATTLPVAAIGGVGLGNIASVFEAGASMACVISALWSEGTGETAMEKTTRNLVAACEAGLAR